ncbi:caspase family protein [Anabaena cylindrica FACHB-243]|uniref:Signal transduction protein with Nacht domain n=1 Tax=Anabaena cylindrica (strain ATCC 27899 / PCC 7122) TaxID=272123 RepID=K9ZQ45_ANACC|nr:MULTISPECIES: caspase family protein [Anabaena]AFZ61343.1 putative signal transduction protein with Nacht domain [Anabaena cylindrica PCC 7122]AZL96581.1 putative Nacht domain-containing signal transduction protein [Anabaena sp. CCAP 1446/1C]MBD2416642.1 caspase family protein [Anabaena cylindrica FACHB-243]MBY5281119.1 NACHT domain-containing protein [Anabaena sp. CCAP 1446/1C]MBY5306745.1 NACHT domain-containing protein [Anabaena sp. CCAP 1446/1C]
MSKKAFILGVNTLGLKYCENDALLISKCLEAHDYEIWKSEPSKYELMAKFDDFISGASQTDTLIFYFSGHGLPSGELRLVLNGNLQHPQDWIDINYITKAFRDKECKALNKLIILDCCSAGSAEDTWTPGQSDRYFLMTASQRLEKTKEIDELKASFLTFYIHKALTESPSEISDIENRVRINNLYEWLTRKSKEHNIKKDIQVPLPNLLGNQRHNFEIAIIERKRQYQQSEPILESPNNLNNVNLLEAYLRWLIEQHNRLELRGVREANESPTVLLEKVYVALKGDRTTYKERIEANKLLDKQVQEILGFEPITPEEKELWNYIRRQILREHPIMLSLEERDRSSSSPIIELESITLGEAFQKDRWLVILGDPGSGKTTLARWLTVKLAQAMLNGDGEVIVPLAQVDPEVTESDKIISLGLPRLPVILRVSDYAEAYQKKPLMLVEYLGYHPWLGQFLTHAGEKLPSENLNKLIKDYLNRGEAVIILDGMDEITSQREEIVLKIEEFIKDWIDIKGQPKSQYMLPTLSIDNQVTPMEIGGNQIIITSRIAGYHASPIRRNVTQVTIEPMSRVAVEHFCDTWTLAIHQLSIAKDKSESEAAEKQAIKEAKALKVAIYDPNRPRIRELASNPLLVTILGMVFHRRGSLPEQRANLYQLAMEILMEDWCQQRDWYKTGLIASQGLTAEELTHILSPLAAHIHQNYATGLIEYKELKTIISQYLDELPKFKSKSQLIGEKVDNFIQIVQEDIGLLAARGQFLYGFLHLTFQEYLAALYLIRSKDTAAQEIISRLDDPRWREPILLVLGHISSNWASGECKEILQALLDADDPLGDLLPRTPLLMAIAMEEMGNISEQIVEEVAKRLLFAYADHDKLAQFEKLRKQIENAFIRLQDNSTKLIERVLCDALRNPPESRPDVAPAAAALIHKYNWFTDKITQALLDALPNDSEKWNWAINNCIQEIINPITERREPTEPTQPTEKEWRILRETDFAKYQEQKTNFAVAQAAYEEQRNKYEKWTRRQQVELPRHKLPLKSVLQKNSRLVERIKSNPMWLRLTVALYGGYYDYKAQEILSEYRELALFLNKPDYIREQEIARNREYYIGKFGSFDDPSYSIAVYLETDMGGRMGLARKPPEFTAEAIYCDSPLTEVLLSALRQGEAPESLIPKLWTIWKGSNNPVLQVDALIALAALGENIISELQKALASSTHEEIASSVLKKFSQLRSLLQDSVTRAIHKEINLPKPVADPSHTKNKDEKISKRHQLIVALDKLSSELNDLHWNDVVATLANVMLTYCNKPLDYTPWEDNLSEAQKDYINAEYWVIQLLGGLADDIIYNAAVALDKMTVMAPNLIINSLSLVHQTQNLNWDEYISEWVVEDLSPRIRDSSDIPLEVMGAIENIGIEKLRPDFIGAAISVFIGGIIPLVIQNTDLLPEILTLNLRNNSDSERIVKLLAPQLNNNSRLPDAILRMAYDIQNPYYCSRALLRLARYFPLQGEPLRRKSLEVARAIFDPHQKCRVFEYLIPHLDTQEPNNILEEVLSAARTILDPDDKTRTLARLSRYFQQEKQEKLLHEAIQTASLITDEYQRSETLSLLYPLLFSEPDLLTEYFRTAQNITDSWSKFKALRLRSPQLLQIHDQLQKATEGDIDLWTPVVLGTIVNDVLTHFENISTVDGLWLALANFPDTAKVEKLYEAGIEKGLTLTRIAATTLDQLLNIGNDEIVHKFLPLLQDPTPDAIPVIESWLEHWDEFIVNHAALLLSEKGRRLTPRTIQGLLKLVKSRVDRSRIRATLVLCGGIIGVKREQRVFRASELGEEIMNALGQAINDYKEELPYIVHVAILTQYDIIHDDPNLIEQWAEIVNTNADGVNGAEENLKGIAELTSEGWKAFLSAFETGNNRVRKAMMHSLCWLLLPENKQNYTEDPSYWLKNLSIEGMEDIRALQIYEHTSAKITPCPVIESALIALQQKRENPDINLIEAAEKALDEYTISAATALVGEVGNIKNLLGKIALSNTFPLGTGGSLFSNASEKYAVIIDNEPEIFQLLVAWLAQTLANSVCNEGYFCKLTVLLVDVAVYAELSPATFVNLARENNLEPLLAETVKKHNPVPGRVAAIKLISYLDKITTSTVNVLQDALFDEHEVELAVIETFTRIRRIEGDMLEQLFGKLYDDSAKVAYTSAQILSLLGKSERTKPEQRKKILQKLADAVRSPSSKRGIYETIGNGGSSDYFLRLSYQGKLNQAFFQALLEISGVL